MSRIEQPSDGHGSLKDTQLLINEYPKIINNQIKLAFPDLKNDSINWNSPLKNDGYAEYRDNEFIKLMGLNETEINLADFWPLKGPQWDALASTTNNNIILVEAKANIPEMVSPPTGAGEKSKTLIDKSLLKVKEYLGSKNINDWAGTFYQCTNRLAHLYFLREMCNKPAYLINIFFISP